MSVERTTCSTTKIDISNQRYNYHILKSFCFLMFFYVECLKSNLSTWQCTAIFRGIYSFIIPQRGGGNQWLLGLGKKIKEWKTRAGKETAREREGEKEGEREAEGKDKGKGKKKENKIRVQKQMKEKRIWGERKWGKWTSRPIQKNWETFWSVW